jgi:hypothetical protein
MALDFRPGAACFVACPVKVSDLAFHPDGMYPEKVKGPGLCAPCWEVDSNGDRRERAS